MEAKPAVKKAARADPPPVPAAKEAKKQSEPADVWGSLTEGSSTSIAPRKSGVVRKPRAATAGERTSQKKWLIGGGVAVGVLLMVLLGMWTSGVFKVKTKDGTIVLENLPDDAEVLVDGETVTLKAGEGKTITITAGKKHQLQVKKEGFKVFGKEVEIDAGGRRPIRVSLQPETAMVDKRPPQAPEREAESDGFVPLFNGKDKSGWNVDGGPAGQWVVEGNTIVGQSKDFKTRNYLLTEKDYSDFILRFEFRVEENSHGGVAIRAIEGEKVPYNNNLIVDHPLIKLTNPAMENVEPTGMTHWLRKATAFWGPVEILNLPTGIWRPMEVIVRGDHCTATVDGKKLVDVTLDPDARNSGAFIPGLGRRKGKVGFQINTGIVRYRKIEIKELSSNSTSPEPRKPEAKNENSFFNEEDLTGWEGLPDYWQAKNGCIVGEQPERQAHTFLCSKKSYRDFDLKFRVKREGGFGNSGVQFRSKIEDRSRFTVVGPQCEIDDLNFILPPGSLVTEPNGDPLKVRPSAAALEALAKVYKEDAFNDFHIRCVGKHVTIQVNDVTTVDGDFPSLPEEGIIAWQLNGYRPQKSVMFRIVEFTDLSAAASADGFVPLFNGKDLNGWQVADTGNIAEWAADNGVLYTNGRGGWLMTDKEYSNFDLHLEFKLSEASNSGVALRSPMKGDPALVGMEIQLLDDVWYKKTENKLAVTQLTGAIYDVVPPSREALQPIGEWNTLRIVANGRRVTVELNGVRITDANLDEHKAKTAKHPGLLRDKGTIGLQSQTGRVEFRKIKIKELLATKSETPRATGAAAEEKDFIQLFNGKDTKGWTTHRSQPGNWRVEKGVLIGSGDGVSHLYTNRGNYTDFHLLLEVRINGGGNSGVYFRAPFGPNLPARVKFPVSPSNKLTWIAAYNAKIDAPRFGRLLIDQNPELHWTRVLALQPGEWITYEIIIKGNHIVIKVNGETTSDFTDDQRHFKKGHIVLQQHGPQTVVEFRKIKIKELK